MVLLATVKSLNLILRMREVVIFKITSKEPHNLIHFLKMSFQLGRE